MRQMPAYRKVCYVSNKKNHFNVCCPCVGKKVHEIEKDESDETSDQKNYEFFIETNNNQNSAHIRQIKNENSDWSLYPWMGFLFHRKLIPEINVTLFLWQFWKSLILNPNYFQWTYSYPHIINLKFSYLECSLTLKHKNNHFDVLFIVVDSKSIPILGLSNSESLNLIKHISAVNASDEQFLSEFFFIVLEKQELSKILTILKSRII